MNVFRSKHFEKSLKKILSGGKIKLIEIEATIDILASGEKIPVRYRDHALKGEWKGYRECHIKPDVLLIYTIQKEELVLMLIDIGSHAELFK
jgi:mRNA interferase YafQ